MLSRRVLLALVAGLAFSRTADAQSPSRRYRVGILSVGANPRSAPFYVAFEERLRQLGYIENENLVVDFLRPERPESLARTAAELVRLRPDAILAAGPEASVRALREVTRTVPVVIVALNYDPVAKGYVASLARPAGNVTGLFARSLEVNAKQLELLREVLPHAARLALLWEASAADQAEAAEVAARTLRVALFKMELTPPYDVDRAFATMVGAGANGVHVVGSPVLYRERTRLAASALKHRLPAIASPDFAVSGMLLGYGIDLSDALRGAADYVDRILKGARPADLPVQQATKFDLVINLKTAKALGLTVPPSLLARAVQVIE